MFKDFQSTFWISKTSCSGHPSLRYKRYSLSGPKILHLSPTRDFNHASLKHVTSTIRHFDTSFQQSITLLWRIVEMTCQSDEWSKSRVVVTDGWSVGVEDFRAWVGPTFVSNQGYSPGAEILQDICFDYKKSRYGCFLSIYLQNTQVCLKNFL